MGLLYYVVDDARKEYFELGKGWWNIERDHDAFTSPEKIRAYVRKSLNQDGYGLEVSDPYIEVVAKRLIDFIRGPVRLIHDGSDELDDMLEQGYKLVGDRYIPEGLS